MNKEQTENKERIQIDIVKSDFKKVISAHKRFSLQGKNVEGSNLSAINFKIKDNELTLTTTDGYRALISKLAITDNYGEDGEFNLSMALVSKLALIKSEVDVVRIVSEDNNVQFIDEIYNSVQTLPRRFDTYPKVEQVIPAKTNFSVRVSQRLIKDIASLRTPKGYVDIQFNTKCDTQAIIVEAKTEEVTQTGILMPIAKEDIKS